MARHVTKVQGRDEITVKLYKSHFPSGAVSGGVGMGGAAHGGLASSIGTIDQRA